MASFNFVVASGRSLAVSAAFTSAKSAFVAAASALRASASAALMPAPGATVPLRIVMSGTLAAEFNGTSTFEAKPVAPSLDAVMVQRPPTDIRPARVHWPLLLVLTENLSIEI